MRTVNAKKLTLEDYHSYGEFANLTDPKGEYIGESPVRFYRDMVSAWTGNVQTAFSIVQVDRMKMIPSEAEQHEKGTEVLIPMEDDVVIFVAPATNKEYPYGREEAFIIPKGYMVTIKPGVWHKAPYPLNREKASTLVILPEREYAVDCINVSIENDQQFEIIV